MQLIKKFNFKKILPALVLVAVLYFIGSMIMKAFKPSQPETTTNNQQSDIVDAKASMDINKEYSFPIKDQTGKEVTKINYVIEKAELRNEIIVKGQKAVSIKGKTFLILSIKMINTYDKPIDIHSRDFVRLVKNGNDKELLAADIHNDPVNVQAISTKSTRIGFPISDSDKDLKILVGEIKETKDTINLTF